MSNFINPADLILQPNWKQFLVENRKTVFQIPLDTGELYSITGQWLLFNTIMCRPVLVRQLPIKKAYLLHNKVHTADAIESAKHEIFKDLVKLRESGVDIYANHPRMNDPIMRMLIKNPKCEPILAEMVDIINELNNAGITHLGAYHRAIDFVGIERTLNHPRVKEARTFDIGPALNVGISAVESTIKDAYKRCMDVLCDDNFVEGNVFYPFRRLGIVSTDQLSQVAVAAGTRTDANDLLISYPIVSSYTQGMNGIVEYMIEMLAAKKSILYNATELGTSQYNNRKAQLMGSVIRRIYKGDCGSTLPVPFEINAINAKHLIGKYIVHNNELVELTEPIIKDRMGKIVNMRSSLTCRHTDGVCHACGGSILRYTPPQTVIGIIAAQTTLGQVGQKILSNKHHTSTNSIIYSLPPALSEFAYVVRNEIVLKSSVNTKNLMLIFPFSCVTRITDLQYVENRNAINEQHFTNIVDMKLADAHSGEEITGPIVLATRTGTIPYLSSEFLNHLIDHPELTVMKDGHAEIKVGDFDKTKPLMKFVVQNDSMPAFVRRVQNLFTNDIEKYNSIPEILKDFSNLMYTKVGVNIMYLEIMLKSSLITHSTDFRIPIVQDIEDVQFGKLHAVIPGRSIGTMFAFEQLQAYFKDPLTWLIPKEPGVFDPHLGFLD